MLTAGAAIACAIFSGCSGNTGIPPTEHEEVLEQVRLKDLAIKELEQRVEDAEETAAFPPQLKKAREQIDDLKDEKEDAEEALKKLQEEFEEYKKTYRVSIRGRELNHEFDRIVTEEKTFEDVVVKSADGAGIRIDYKEGTGRIRFDQLDDHMKELFGYDPEAAATQLAQEEKQREARLKLAAERKRLASTKVGSISTKKNSPEPERPALSPAQAVAEVDRLTKFVDKTRRRLVGIEERAAYGKGGNSAAYREAEKLRTLMRQAEARIEEVKAMFQK